MIKRNIALLSALSSRNRPKMTSTSSPSSLLVMNLGCLCQRSWDKAAVISVEDSNFTVTRKAQKVQSNVKSVLICCFDIEGIVPKEFVLPGQMVNVKLYCDLRWSRENIRLKRLDKWCNNSWALHHDNAVAHALLMQQFLASTYTIVISHPPYLPDLTPCDVFSIPEDEIEA